MPVILTTQEEREVWLRAPWSIGCDLQRPLADGALQIVLRGPKQDGDDALVNLAERACRRVPTDAAVWTAARRHAPTGPRD